MNWLIPSLIATPIALLLANGLLSGRSVNKHPLLYGRLTVYLCLGASLSSLVAALHLFKRGPIDATLFEWMWPVPVCLGLHVDALAVVMMALISVISLSIARFSMRYLSGDPGQGQFFRWMSLTVGATLLLVVSCNLVMLFAAWMLTSVGLHQLLIHYPERTWAVWAARKKFLISRLGDMLLITGIILAYQCFGTTEYREIFAAAEAIHAGTSTGGWATGLIGILFVLGAMTKSAQFPFHSWLPDTMEAPTPVSALMHAGVINAGGFLIIRLSPLVSLSPIALDLLAVIGAVTAILGSLVMLTQTSIKRCLAYSTIAQMGFMMLQCGLGAFSAALLHIVAHSAYKAHAFLSCGSVLDRAATIRTTKSPVISAEGAALAFAVAITVGTALTFGCFAAFGIDIVSKPGGAVLGVVMILAQTQMLWNALATGRTRLILRSLAGAVLIIVTYSIAYQLMDRFLTMSTSHHRLNPSAFELAIFILVASGFIGVFTLQALSMRLANHRWLQALYVHTMNGFYIDIPARQLTAWFYRQSAPVQ